MSSFPRLPWLAAALTLLTLGACSKSNDATAAPPAAAKTYTLNLTPALVVGQKFSVVTDLSDTELTKITITVPGMPAPQDQNQNTSLVAHIEADGEVLAIYPNGSAQKIALTLKAITATNNQTALPNLPAAGAKVVVEKTAGSITVTVDGQPAPAGIGKILRDVFESGDEKYTNQAMFGPKAPVAIGDSWPVDSASLLSSFKQAIGDVSAIKGTMKLDGLTGTGDGQVAEVSGTVNIDGFKPPLPAGVNMTIDSSSGLMHMAGSIPSIAKGTDKGSTSMTIKLEAHGEQQGLQLKISTSGEQKKTSTITFP